jgi:uncharacterized membrane protein YesL
LDHPTFFQEFGSVFCIIKVSLKDIWEDIWSVLVINLVWTLCMLVVVPGPPATLALYPVCQPHGTWRNCGYEGFL